MFSLLLAIIYLAFISLGLPDSLLGSAWPVMQVDLDAPLSYAGIVSMIIAGGRTAGLFHFRLFSCALPLGGSVRAWRRGGGRGPK